jgi:hypothetical protein
MMTDRVDAVGFLPAALSTRIGAQTQRPLAVVVIGGALAIALLTRVLQPALVYLCYRRLRLADAQGGACGATKPGVCLTSSYGLLIGYKVACQFESHPLRQRVTANRCLVLAFGLRVQFESCRTG